MVDESMPAHLDSYTNTSVAQYSQTKSAGTPIPTARPNHKRSKNFSDQEDEVLSVVECKFGSYGREI